MKALYFKRDVLENLARQVNEHDRDEMAIPSYLHKNPAIRWLIQRRMQTVLEYADLQPGQKLLDYGCGTGMLFLQLPTGSRCYFGVDLKTSPAATFLNAHDRDDVQLLSTDDWMNVIPDSSMDVIVALEVLEHVDEVRELADEFAKKLKSDGKLVICGPTENALYALGRKIAGFSGEYHHRNIFHIMKDVEAAGFVALRQRSLPLPGLAALFVASVYTRSE